MKKVIIKATDNQLENLQALLEQGDNDLPTDIQIIEDAEMHSMVEIASHYLSNDVEELEDIINQLEELEDWNQDLCDALPDIIVWQPLTYHFSVESFLDIIGYDTTLKD